jgi:hypothetical protein
MKTKAERAAHRSALLLGWLVIIGGAAFVALGLGAWVAWIWTWGEVGWRGMRWLMGVS